MSVTSDVNAIHDRLKQDGIEDAYWPEVSSRADIELAELETGLPLPDEVKDFLLAGGFPDWFVVYTTWELLSLEFMVNSYQENLDLYGSSSQLENENKWKESWLPVASNNGGDYLFVDTEQSGLFRYRHFDGDVKRVTDDFAQFIANIRKDVEQGEYKLSRDETPEYVGTVEIS